MLRSLKELFGYSILALDGEIGKVHDIYFDDENWVLRYLVVDTGPWILGRKVLISPVALGQPDWMVQKFPINLSREDIEKSPEIDSEKPVSRSEQKALHEYFSWPAYWAAPLAYTQTVRTVMKSELQDLKEKDEQKVAAVKTEPETNLRRAKEVIGYQVKGRDDRLGKVADFILDDATWDLRYLVLDTKGSGDKKVLIAPFWIKWIRFDEKKVFIDLNNEVITDSPGFDPNQPIQRDYEEVLYDYYGRPYYWVKR
jgi:sporulation protein YlmC with PRC-barrel domain